MTRKESLYWRESSLALAIVIALLGGGHAYAQDHSETMLQKARLALTDYGLSSGSTLEIVRELAPLAAPVDLLTALSGEDLQPRFEARFLRAAVAVDLLVIATVTPEQITPAQIAQAYGTDGGSLLRQLQADLHSLSSTRFHDASREVLSLLGMLSDAPGRDQRLLTGHGVRRDLLLGARVVALLDERYEPSVTLAAFGADPCVAQNACAAPYRQFDERGRRAMHALREGGRALSRVAEAARNGDALAVSLTLETTLYLQRLREITLRPRYRLGDESQIALVEEGLSSEQPDCIAIVGSDALTVGFVPRVRLDEAGELELVGEASPMLPQTARVALPASYRPYYGPIGEVMDGLTQLLPQNRSITIAVGFEPNVPADVLARVLLSLDAMGQEPQLLARRRADGTLATLPLRLSRAAGGDEAPLSLRVRLGGFSLRRAGAFSDIPRVRTHDGFRFDLETLEQQLAGAPHANAAALSFMSGVPTHTLMSAAVRMASVSSRIELQVP